VSELTERLRAATARRLHKSAKHVKILTIDIETKPMVVYSWGLWKQNHFIEQIVDDGGVMCFGAKWLGQKEVIFHSERDGFEAMMQAAWDLLDDADVVVGYNSTKFDIPRLNQEFMKLGWAPPSPFKEIDLIRVNRQRFQLPSRKLDYLASRAGVGSKVKHQGFDLWVSCMAGDESAWATMERYCKGDVALTEKVYLRLLPWMTGTPHIGLLTGVERACPSCGSDKLVRTGKKVHAYVSSYSLFRCSDCGGWARDVFKANEPVRTRPVK
jgi:predicted RNA-binding Zn-ribbon protein involved in translation (DUF1610 family)